MLKLRDIGKFGSSAWDVLRSPRTLALLKLGAAVVATIHAIDEFANSSRIGKTQIGFRRDNE